MAQQKPLRASGRAAMRLEAAEREREQAREEKRERLAEVRRHIVSWANADLVGDCIVFTLDGYRYELREVAAHREE